MKARAQIAVVDQMAHHLTLAAALGLGDGSELKWIVLVPNENEHAWYESDLTRADVWPAVGVSGLDRTPPSWLAPAIALADRSSISKAAQNFAVTGMPDASS